MHAGVVVSAGHTDATADELDRAVGRGSATSPTCSTPCARSATAIRDRSARRSPTPARPRGSSATASTSTRRRRGGLAGARPAPAQPRHRCRVGDGAGLRPGPLGGRTGSRVGDDGVRIADGVLAGSALSLDEAVRNLVAFTGCSVADAVATVTSTPARLLGLADARDRSRRGATPTSRCSTATSASSPPSWAAARSAPHRGRGVEVVIVADATEIGRAHRRRRRAAARQRARRRCSAWRPAARRWPVYDELVRRCAAPARSASPGRPPCLLDEYVGLPPGTPSRTARSSAAVHRSGRPRPRQRVRARRLRPTTVAACRSYDGRSRRAGGVDLQLLGHRVATATSASTSPDRRSARGPGSRR